MWKSGHEGSRGVLKAIDGSTAARAPFVWAVGARDPVEAVVPQIRVPGLESDQRTAPGVNKGRHVRWWRRATAIL